MSPIDPRTQQLKVKTPRPTTGRRYPTTPPPTINDPRSAAAGLPEKHSPSRKAFRTLRI